MNTGLSVSLLWLITSYGALCVVRPDCTYSRGRGDKQPDTSEVVIILERKTDHFEVAPAYKITICADGTVIYEGGKNAKTVGVVKSSISRQDLQKLIKKLEEIDYFGLRDKYENRTDGCPFRLEDASYVYTAVKFKGREKSVTHYLGCVESHEGYQVFPQKLFQLEELIDKTVNASQWIN